MRLTRPMVITQTNTRAKDWRNTIANREGPFWSSEISKNTIEMESTKCQNEIRLSLSTACVLTHLQTKGMHTVRANIKALS